MSREIKYDFIATRLLKLVVELNVNSAVSVRQCEYFNAALV